MTDKAYETTLRRRRPRKHGRAPAGTRLGEEGGDEGHGGRTTLLNVVQPVPERAPLGTRL